MVILIGAESYTGKTLMAQKLLEKYSIPYFSIDHLKMGLYRANPNCGFSPDDSNETIEKHLWPIVKGIMMTNIENDQSIIIEGCYLFPNRLKEFDENDLKHIIPVFMGFSEEYIKRNYTSVMIGNRSVIEKRDDHYLPVDSIIFGNKKLKSLCEESNAAFFEIDEDYEKDTHRIYQWIDRIISGMEKY